MHGTGLEMTLQPQNRRTQPTNPELLTILKKKILIIIHIQPKVLQCESFTHLLNATLRGTKNVSRVWSICARPDSAQCSLATLMDDRSEFPVSTSFYKKENKEHTRASYSTYLNVV